MQDLADDRADLLLQVQPQIDGHLIIPAPGRMQTLAGIADALGQERLHIHVDILLIGGKFDLPRLDISQNRLQAGDDGVGIFFCNNAALAQHRRMGDGACDILPVHSAVKADGGVEVVD